MIKDDILLKKRTILLREVISLNSQCFSAEVICNNYINYDVTEDDFTDLPRPRYAIAFVVQGRIMCMEENRNVIAQAGDVVFLPLHLRYLLRWIGDPIAETITCHFLLPPENDLLADKLIPLQKIQGEDLKESFSFLLANGKAKEQRFAVLSRFYELLDHVYHRLTYTAAPKLDDRIQKAVNYLRVHCDRTFAVEDIATLCNMSPSRFYHRFKAETGLTPIAYKNKMAAHRAALLLLNDPEKSVEEIATETGFASAAYFRRVFKDVTGKTPREYRSRMAEQ